MIKAVIFDCFGVLTTDKWRAFIDKLPKSADTQTAREAHRAYCAGVLTKQEAAQKIQTATGQAFMEPEDNLREGPAKNTLLLAYIKQLKPKYKIGLLSNVATNWIRDAFLTADEQKLFDAFVFSYEAGTTKPDPRIFEMMLRKLGIEPSEAIMVDDIERYAEAAKATGMHAVWYRDFQQFKDDIEPLLSQQ